MVTIDCPPQILVVSDNWRALFLTLYPPGKGRSFGYSRKQKGAWRCFGGITIQANYAIDGPKVLGPLERWIVSQVGLNA